MSKYRNKPTRCVLKHLHQSKLEANVCNRLWSMVSNKEIAGYKIQQKFPFVVKNKFICNHIVDFWIIRLDSLIEVWEAKGKETKDYKIKRKLFLALYPEIAYKIITKETFHGQR